MDVILNLFQNLTNDDHIMLDQLRFAEAPQKLHKSFKERRASFIHLLLETLLFQIFI